MAGYLFSLDSQHSLLESIRRGVYSTRLSSPQNVWRTSHEGTFADYSSMKEGDNIYFFIDRKIYGIGTLVNIGNDCKFLNYPGSNLPTVQDYNLVQNSILFDYGNEDSLNYRFICTFVPSPFFFRQGVDMDEILTSSPASFTILRAFWKLSFIKFSDEENQAFKNIILRRNINALENQNIENIFETNNIGFHENIRQRVFNNDLYRLSIDPLLNTIVNPNLSMRHEMAIEAAIIHQISNGHEPTINVFQSWDYLSHQVIASPFKPIDYMDKMDIFGYRFIVNQKPTISNYLVIEIKRGVVDVQDILQLMKYVDWVKNEYAFGDYNMIKAYLVGYNFTDNALATFREQIERKFIYGVRPSVAAVWNNVKLVTYRFNQENNLLDFQIIADANE